ncbi:MAG: Phage SPO1 DNA polymerase-related protein [Candidatus Jorgensenbacteria bacterium GW2011_GWA1_48_13]|uniref:Type-4 uracil-DNA glycosylase n=2 Tax=Candidatus Joergenseniibacteriota TaxID=1752739 RepID=A0A0G1W9R0_9BACT|nr:MAG: Phage SPO1 DNA polymerase-related protein [Candidatus Jorgensenbacteria bacterium GW2011_GWA1_48_13]KKU98849.1 MAG: phage SPO1 DNA polymerase-related protein, DNA polymerase bacteriophage-type [Candidatus Jorgensenbacteria bacterium GW2011_GWC1_48_8]KKW15320.1 MAG: Phage SPO1 DNA polymerase-related protein [Candidatus Jorgensenbacteria bacterium GW2011_GWB1_50_10]
MDKREALKALEEEMEKDLSLPLRESNLVFGEGSPDCEAMFIGEGPGFYEDKMKRPFVGRAGQLLDKLILGVGWKREDVYITNVVKRRPPENRDPLPEEITSYVPYLTRQIEIINPRVIVPLGRFAMNYFLPNAKISRDQGKLFKLGERFIYPLFHPAAALRGTGTLNALTESFIKLPEVLKKLDSIAEVVLVEEKKDSQKGLF